jgi:hypothetical protein
MLGTLQRDKDKDYISNSWLGNIKRELLGQPAFYGGARFLDFGKELHRRFLEPHTQPEKFYDWSDEEEQKLEDMVLKLWQNALLKEAFKRSEREIKYVKDYRGVKVLGILDMKYRRIGIDLKTTWTKTRVSFVEAAKRYDYFRQAQLYTKIADLDSFIFVSIGKQEPYPVFELHCNDYPLEMARGQEELDFLIDLHKRYYNVND